MNKTQREQIRNEFIEMIKKSWTYERLTAKERDKVLNNLIAINLYADKTDYVWSELNNVYGAFLDGCGYEPWNWREGGAK